VTRQRRFVPYGFDGQAGPPPARWRSARRIVLVSSAPGEGFDGWMRAVAICSRSFCDSR
jgi:hypothetical protein